MAKILQLDRHVADLIAAGEVVERPASAVKELVENAVDAGATQITVELQNGGMTYLRVSDNGCGIAPEDAETAFLRHATSKLRTKEDLAAIGTLGFRGEALAAIASVSKIDLLTKTRDEEGVSIRLEAGQVVDRSPAGCPEGTTIVVRELFYNTPARLKFMKSDTAEAARILGVVQRQALANPHIGFRVIKDGETVLQTAGGGDLHGTLYQVYGRQLSVEMLPVDSAWENLRLTGFVTKPTATRGNRNYQQFFVNGRPVQSKLLVAALEEAYENQLMTGRYPSCALCLQLPHNQVDVNVHPAKTEVKFANERAVFDCIRFGVLSALHKNPGRPEMTLKREKLPAKQETFRTMTPEQFKTFAQVISQPAAKPVAPQVVKAVQTPKVQTDFVSRIPAMPDTKPAPQGQQPIQVPKSAEPEQTAMELPRALPYRVVGEVLNTYIILEQGEEVLFLDKHAAHERIIFERLKESSAPIMAQVLLTPLAIHMTGEEASAVLEHTERLRQYGFEAEDFGDGTVLLRQIPADLDEAQAKNALEELAQQLLDGHAKNPAALRDELLHTIACKAAIKAGFHTEPAERDSLVKQVMERDDIKYCPHGRPVITTLTKNQLEKQFKRS